MVDDIVKEWVRRECPDLSGDRHVLWLAFRAWAASNRWDATLPRGWVSEAGFQARIASMQDARIVCRRLGREGR